MKQAVHNDEPSHVDSLNREKYAKAFANLTLNCETPMVVGLYGSWGTGKSTLMQLIKGHLDTTRTIPIWFDPWQHQFDENPILALVHTVIEQCGIKDSKKIATVIASALGVSILKSITNISVKDIEDVAKKYEEENFLLREDRVKLKEYFSKLISMAIGKSDKRIVFFIDDLDRCMPDQVMKLLESLKLFLNLPGCVYFLAVDHEAIEQSIEHYYKSIDIKEKNYLDKIVQLPFTIPPVYQDSINDYITPLLPNELIDCRQILIEGLSGNPRELKRFINTLVFNHELSKESRIEGYSPPVLTAVLLLQHYNKDLYKIISNNPKNLLEYIDCSEDEEHGFDELLSNSLGLKRILKGLNLSSDRILGQYLYQTRLLSSESKSDSLQLESILARHKLWIGSNGEKGERANVSAIRIVDTNLSKIDFTDAVFEWSKLNGTDFTQCTLNSASFKNVEASRCILSDVEASNTDFSGGKFLETDCKNTIFKKSIFRKSDFSKALIINTDFVECDCSYMKFVNSKLMRSSFSRTQLNGVNFKDLDLSTVEITECRFERANFTSANLSGKDLSDSDFRAAILYRANLNGSNLSGADLSHSNMQEADVRRVDFAGALLIGADLRKSRGLSAEQIEEAVFDESTQFDDHIRSNLYSESDW